MLMNAKKKTKPVKKPRPRPGYRWLVPLLLALPIGSCSSDDREDAATCAVLGGLVVEHLYFELDCPVDVEALARFSATCTTGNPTETQALECLTDLYALTECPDSFPNSCGPFASEMAPALGLAP